MNFANESACLKADKVQNKVLTIHRSQEVLKILSSTYKYFLQLIVLLKNTCTTILPALTAHQTPTFTG
jgi:hypothetical protein